jgi:hypothetical protein
LFRIVTVKEWCNDFFVGRQHEEAMDALQADIDALEHEKTELRERVKDLSRKTLMEGIVRQSTSAGNLYINIVVEIKKSDQVCSLALRKIFKKTMFFPYQASW